jgi:hypothetical protein
MTNRTFNPAQRAASKGAAHITGTTRVRPVTKLRTIDETAELFQHIDADRSPTHRVGCVTICYMPWSSTS